MAENRRAINTPFGFLSNLVCVLTYWAIGATATHLDPISKSDCQLKRGVPSFSSILNSGFPDIIPFCRAL